VLGGAAAWPLAARAQQLVTASIGFLGVRSPTESAHLLAAFHTGLTESGYISISRIFRRAILNKWSANLSQAV